MIFDGGEGMEAPPCCQAGGPPAPRLRGVVISPDVGVVSTTRILATCTYIDHRDLELETNFRKV